MNFDPPLLKLEQFVTGAANGSRRSLVHHTSLVLVAEVERSNTCEVCACVCVHVRVCVHVCVHLLRLGMCSSEVKHHVANVLTIFGCPINSIALQVVD